MTCHSMAGDITEKQKVIVSAQKSTLSQIFIEVKVETNISESIFIK